MSNLATGIAVGIAISNSDEAEVSCQVCAEVETEQQIVYVDIDPIFIYIGFFAGFIIGCMAMYYQTK